ncbi:hypothetical protein LDENG_00127740 [Lucifuga dentata]|nr:hypothetical protein LDENG_00127740 [Lucifuga dentata]
MIKDARAAYFSQLITKTKENPRVLLSTINRIISPTVPAIPVFSSSLTGFSPILLQRVRDIRSGIVSFPNFSTNDFLHQPLLLDNFAPVSLQDLHNIVHSMPSSTCSLDILPTSFLKNIFHVIGPCLVSIINISLETGSVPVYFKKALVQPLLKKPKLDPSIPES